MKCKNCGTQNIKRAKFCVNCGQELSYKTHENYQNNSRKIKGNNIPSSQFLSVKSLWLIAVTIGATLLIYSIVNSNNEVHNSINSVNTPLNLESSNPVVQAKINEIASEFNCGCGDCLDGLIECGCEYASTERQFIASQIENSMDRGNIIKAVKDKFGGYISNTQLN